ncbi:hypothetical protein CWB99_08930 [Pseudoalteromonas rubra]|uniref:Uncharacterized protein n=2 Tax=Pseudoalteromonas rubra TaxID=43658 RepID=A0A5S3WMI6_9GAMM|nr:hypothetical protein CWB99_08930 [Pseudoalteromonas rubra]TMP34083.1 hypothetical protein CWC00_09310 [Pseudoalteromonas rubra]
MLAWICFHSEAYQPSQLMHFVDDCRSEQHSALRQGCQGYLFGFLDALKLNPPLGVDGLCLQAWNPDTLLAALDKAIKLQPELGKQFYYDGINAFINTQCGARLSS